MAALAAHFVPVAVFALLFVLAWDFFKDLSQ